MQTLQNLQSRQIIINERYRNYRIVVEEYDGGARFCGRLLHSDMSIAEMNARHLDNIIQQLRNHADRIIQQKRSDNVDISPSQPQRTSAIACIYPILDTHQQALLLVHQQQPDDWIAATDLCQRTHISSNVELLLAYSGILDAFIDELGLVRSNHRTSFESLIDPLNLILLRKIDRQGHEQFKLQRDIVDAIKALNLSCVDCGY